MYINNFPRDISLRLTIGTASTLLFSGFLVIISAFILENSRVLAILGVFAGVFKFFGQILENSRGFLWGFQDFIGQNLMFCIDKQ